MKAGLRVSRPSYGNGKEVISLSIGCESSGCQIIELEVGLADFAKALTGQQSEADISFIVSKDGFSNIGKKREVLKLPIEKPDSWGYKPEREQIEQELERLGYLPEWQLWQDGRDSQQNVRGFHNVVLCKFNNPQS